MRLLSALLLLAASGCHLIFPMDYTVPPDGAAGDLAAVLDQQAPDGAIDGPPGVDATTADDAGPGSSWARAIGGTGTDRARAAAVDPSGNLYVTGEFQGTITVGTTPLISDGASDVFVAAFDPGGQPLWAVAFGGGQSDVGLDITVASGRIFVSGSFMSTAQVFSSALTSKGSTDGFLVALDPQQGGLHFARRMGGSAMDRCTGVAAKGTQVCVAGWFSGPLIDAEDQSQSGIGGIDSFVYRFGTTGAPQGFRALGGPDSDVGEGVTMDDQGRCFVTGSFTGAMNLDGYQLSSKGSTDLYVAGLSTGNQVLWAWSAGSSTSDIGHGIAASGSQLMVAGVHTGNIFDGKVNLVHLGSADAFLISLDAASGAPLGSIGIGSTAYDAGFAVTVDEAGNALVTGRIDGPVVFGPGDMLTPVGPTDAFVTSLTGTGQYRWSEGFGGGGSTTIGHGVVTDAATGSVYLVGEFKNTITVGGKKLVSGGAEDGLVVRLPNR